jgi:DNA mismatch repair protein MSH6
VVERQAVAVLSRGTLADADMVAKHPDASYVLAGARHGWGRMQPT